MGEQRGNASVAPVLLLLLLGTLLVPSVQAQTGSVLIDETSISAGNFSTFQQSTFTLSFEIHETDGNAANVSVRVLARSMEGSLLSNESTPLPSFSSFEQRNVSVTVSELPFGYSEVWVQLEGDVGLNTTGMTTSFSRVVQRLRPLNVSFGGLSSVTAEGLLGNGQPSNNLTLHDGDKVRFEFPILNQGDYNWTGAVTLTINNAFQNESNTLSDLRVNASGAILVQIEPNLVLEEGLLTWWLELSENLSNASGTHALAGEFHVGPPPLPYIEASLISNADETQAGELLDVQLSWWNNGSAAFQGFLVCTVDGQEYLNETATLAVDAMINTSFTLTAKPMLISCNTDGSRIAAESPLPFTQFIEMPSAVFESAGTPSPSFTGGPWHKGDHIFGNMLMRNTGDLPGRVRLVFEVNDVRSNGEWTVLNSGSAGEVSASLQFLVSDIVNLAWWLESDDGLVVGEHSGVMPFDVLPQQSVTLLLTNVERGSDGEVTFRVALNLDPGRDREVLLKVGYDTGDSIIYLMEQPLTLQPGLMEQSIDFGRLSGERLVAQISAVDWSIGPGPLSTTTALPSEATVYWIEFAPVTSPIRPVHGDETTVTLTFRQSGPTSVKTGEVWLVDAYGSILSNQPSPAWNGKDTVSMEVPLIWPKGSSVALRSIWHIDDSVVTESTSYVSGQVVVDTSFDWPVGAIAWGLVLGAALVLGARLRYRTAAKPRVGAVNESSPPPPLKQQPSDEKREISCPECDRRLRVPASYSGSVGCPDCATKFSVEAEVTEQIRSEPAPSEDHSIPKQSQRTSDGKLDIACPDCSQSLRIPASYEGSVRCPACTKIFKANEGVTLLE
jgi:uncharacterized CHY-type Zn-finger protein